MTTDHAPAADAPEWTFEAALERLEEIVERLDGQGLELDESLAETVLEGADARVRQLLEGPGGDFRLDDFPDPL
jgi:exonuclease VII small subunit